jgi:STE24 endopeptidase
LAADTILTAYLLIFTVQLLVALGLDLLNLRHVQRNLTKIPEFFRDRIDIETYQRAAAYTAAKQRLGIVETLVGSALLLLLILTGVFGRLDSQAAQWQLGEFTTGIVFIWLLSLIFGAAAVPFNVYAVFVIEERFGFNRMTFKTWLADLLKSVIVGAIITAPLLWMLFWILDFTGPAWWIYAFGFFALFQLLIMYLYPAVIAPLFNRFNPLPDGDLRQAILDLARRARFRHAGIFVMDGSKRSSHGNAYFTGLGKNKRIVLFDTLLTQLNAEQTVGVLAHEIGHQLKHHVLKLLLLILTVVFAGFWLLGQLIDYPPFFEAFGLTRVSAHGALAVFAFASAPFTFFLTPALASLSRRFEYAADRFAAEVTGRPLSLADALWELSRHNLVNFTPHPWYSFFHYSHPTLPERVRALMKQEQQKPAELGRSDVDRRPDFTG